MEIEQKRKKKRNVGGSAQVYFETWYNAQKSVVLIQGKVYG